ncbi:MAG TPA: thrombospondin type 3 repeat-containing protein, partial [Methylomirabilota bacterium]|nr:thrombospondin type 3 repeat-containing protein [Methylomirabilota bacterium]
MNLRRNILLWCIAVALASRLIPTVVAADTDGDGLPDDWELQYGFPAGNLADNLPPGLTTYHARFIRPITLANQSGKAWANAEVRLVVDTAGLILDGKMAVDGRDLRFAAIAGVSDSPDKM